MTPLKLAWRNVWRQRRRTILLIIVVAYATLSTVFFWGMIEGQTASMLANQARYLHAPALVTTTAYHDDPDPENALPSLDFVDEAAAVEGVRGAAPRIDFYGLLRSAYGSENVQGRGVDPELEGQVSNLPGDVAEGRMLAGPGEVVLGQGLAERLDVRLGERVALDVSSTAGPQALGLILVGTVDANVGAVDDTALLVHLEDARALTGVATATGVALDVARGAENEVAARVDAALPEGALRAYGLTALLGPLSQEIENAYLQMLPIGLLFALFAALAVTSTVFVSVIERSREFGMMGAIGMAPPRLALMVVFEAVIATVLGWLVGLVLGYTLTWIFGTWNVFGALYSEISTSFAEFGIGEELYTLSKPIYALYAGATVAFAAFFALLVPARRVATMKVADAMRAE